MFGKSFDLGFGGKGANQAIAARLCGAEVVMVAKVGSDLFGEATIRNFASFGIDTTHVQLVQGASTGVAPIFVEPNGQNRIIVVKGANDRLLPADVDAAAALLRGVDTIILQFEIPLETVYHAVRFARARGIRCIVNPAPALPANLAELTAADYFIPNETEAELITGHPVHTLEEARGMCRGTAAEGLPPGGAHARRARLADRRRGRQPPRAAVRGQRPSILAVPATPSSAASRCSSPRASRSRRPWRARISTRRCPRRGSERRSHFRSEPISKPNGPGAGQQKRE